MIRIIKYIAMHNASGTAMPGASRIGIAVLILTLAASAGGDETADPERRQYTYAWMFTEDGAMRPRGGATEGAGVALAKRPSPAWQELTGFDGGKTARDRLAIRAMAGTYRTSFDFIETIGFTADYEPRRPYQSWATEYIFVIADEPDFISLQHILVMRFQEDDGGISGPMVMKHWRQDWRYEDRDLHVYTGRGTWERRQPSRQAVEGTWSQTVYQVGGSPRYEAIGRWVHRDSHSTWTSETTWRPLPRREFSVRDDYDLLAGTNRVTITPRGWTHEQDNLKLALAEDGSVSIHVARETGLNRYERIVDFDVSAGKAYWERTAPYWRLVREAWREIYNAHDRFSLQKEAGDAPLHRRMFEMAARFESDAAFGVDEARRAIDETLSQYLE